MNNTTPMQLTLNQIKDIPKTNPNAIPQTVVGGIPLGNGIIPLATQLEQVEKDTLQKKNVQTLLAHVATVLSANKPDDELLKAPFDAATEIIRLTSTGNGPSNKNRHGPVTDAAATDATGGSRKRSKKAKRRRTLRK
jgi:hypothetical protein